MRVSNWRVFVYDLRTCLIFILCLLGQIAEPDRTKRTAEPCQKERSVCESDETNDS